MGTHALPGSGQQTDGRHAAPLPGAGLVLPSLHHTSSSGCSVLAQRHRDRWIFHRLAASISETVKLGGRLLLSALLCLPPNQGSRAGFNRFQSHVQIPVRISLYRVAWPQSRHCHGITAASGPNADFHL